MQDIKANYIVVSSDCHAGADLNDYKPYLESRWHEEFEQWASTYDDPWVELDPGSTEDPRMGVSSSVQSANWDSARRQADLESDGIAGEILFPNTAPPFFPSGAITALPPRTREDYERRWAGLQAHNRWMVDFCNELPGRRAGMVQLFLNDVDAAVAEVEWARNQGLRGVLIPIMDPGSGLPPLYSDVYEPLWSTCEALDLTVTSHAGSSAGLPDEEASTPCGRTIGLFEFLFFSHRSLWHLIYGGIFERHPNLRFAMTEQGTGWVPQQLAELDAFYDAAKTPGRNERFFSAPVVDNLPLRPSEYFKRNCYIGASFMLPSEVETRKTIGSDRIMWGSDYPHSEGTFPWTREALRVTFSDVPEPECRPMLGETAAQIYGLDLRTLREVADRIGPRVDEVAEPLETYPQVPTETNSPVFYPPSAWF